MHKFAVIGDPVKHSLSPALHRWIFKSLNLDASYNSLHCKTEDLPGIAENLRCNELQGINITIPHKVSIIPFLDDLNIKAQHIGAVNCVVSRDKYLVGFNTDWYGFSMALRAYAVDVRGGDFFVLGAGGAARSILYTLLREGAKSVIVINQPGERSDRLIRDMAKFKASSLLDVKSYEALTNLPEGAVIINCTPVGMHPGIDACPIDETLLSPSHTVVDTIYTPLETQLLRQASRIGAKTLNGLNMFIYQALASLDLWFDEEISPRVDLRGLKEHLEDSIAQNEQAASNIQHPTSNI
ncbi:MAG: shikimate dehydrogenase [FCB group bacterium]|nr:shikimate dehydrogenase [FCB group bacterium]